MPSSSFLRSVTLVRPAPSSRALACPSVKLLAPFSSADAATMFVVPVAVAADGALPVVLTAGLEDPVGLPVPGDAGGMFEPAGGWFVAWARAALDTSMAAADIAISFRKIPPLFCRFRQLGCRCHTPAPYGATRLFAKRAQTNPVPP